MPRQDKQHYGPKHIEICKHFKKLYRQQLDQLDNKLIDNIINRKLRGATYGESAVTRKRKLFAGIFWPATSTGSTADTSQSTSRHRCEIRIERSDYIDTPTLRGEFYALRMGPSPIVIKCESIQQANFGSVRTPVNAPPEYIRERIRLYTV